MIRSQQGKGGGVSLYYDFFFFKGINLDRVSLKVKLNLTRILFFSNKVVKRKK